MSNCFSFNSVFFDCVDNSDQLGKELRIAEENLKKDLRGKNNLVLLF
jgi:hypothetical protein